MVRWRVLAPVLLLLSLAAPAVRAIPGGMWLPDLWLLLCFGAIPARASDRTAFTLQLVFLCGILRSSVSAVSLFQSWAGLAWALALREVLHVRFSEESFILRFLVGVVAALPPHLLDVYEGAQLGLEPAWMQIAFRLVLVGLFWAVVRRPGPRRFRNHS